MFTNQIKVSTKQTQQEIIEKNNAGRFYNYKRIFVIPNPPAIRKDEKIYVELNIFERIALCAYRSTKSCLKPVGFFGENSPSKLYPHIPDEVFTRFTRKAVKFNKEVQVREFIKIDIDESLPSENEEKIEEEVIEYKKELLFSPLTKNNSGYFFDYFRVFQKNKDSSIHLRIASNWAGLIYEIGRYTDSLNVDVLDVPSALDVKKYLIYLQRALNSSQYSKARYSCDNDLAEFEAESIKIALDKIERKIQTSKSNLVPMESDLIIPFVVTEKYFQM